MLRWVSYSRYGVKFLDSLTLTVTYSFLSHHSSNCSWIWKTAWFHALVLLVETLEAEEQMTVCMPCTVLNGNQNSLWMPKLGKGGEKEWMEKFEGKVREGEKDFSDIYQHSARKLETCCLEVIFFVSLITWANSANCCVPWTSWTMDSCYLQFENLQRKITHAVR